ncbi:MAG: hypothetical protein ACRCYY_12370 [Trueperaceae bacterium]
MTEIFSVFFSFTALTCTFFETCLLFLLTACFFCTSLVLRFVFAAIFGVLPLAKVFVFFALDFFTTTCFAGLAFRKVVLLATFVLALFTDFALGFVLGGAWFSPCLVEFFFATLEPTCLADFCAKGFVFL